MPYEWPTMPASDPYQALIQALVEASETPGSSSSGSVGRDDTTGGYSRGSQFQPGNLPGNSSLPDWLTNPNLPPGMSEGSMTGLSIADNAGTIGRVAGSLSGVPGGSMLGRALANALASRYFDSHVFMSPADTPQSELADGLDTLLYGAVPQQSGTLGDNSGRANDSNASFTAGQMFGNGSRMNPTSAFIWALPGFSNQRTEPMRINQRIHRDKPGG